MGQLGAKTDRILPVPYDTDLLSIHEQDPERFPFLLESVAYHPEQGRYDILFAEPLDEIRAGRDFLRRLDEAWRFNKHQRLIRPPFAGGWFLFLPYELAGEIEPSLVLPTGGEISEPFAVRFPAAIVRDHSTEEAWAVADHEGLAVLPSIAELAGGHRQRPSGLSRPGMTASVPVEEAPEIYKSRIAKTKRYIANGDIFQANLSRVWKASLKEGVSPTDIYRSLRHTNPAPFASIGAWRGLSIVSSSPERLLSSVGGRVMTRPIAGTRPRGVDSDSDRDLHEELFRNDKERAEHVMLIDLERNDLGRICKAGSVRVNEFMVRESYAHVHHIVSNVVGELRDGVTPGEAIGAVFPGGTITGCPKVRCMEIIAELESEPRGVYTGSLGYLNHDGSLDLNILIRTIVVNNRTALFRAGGGIVSDSDPDQEVEETRAKAKGMLLALSGSRS